MDLIIESWDSQRGIIIAKHVEDRDTGFEKLKVRKICFRIGRNCINVPVRAGVNRSLTPNLFAYSK